ncbi:MAG: AraC family transcriptional regulator [Eubacteriales bacterium]|nr:AraC family transcriptional regulator [Eubacteriales bacterium]
MNTETRIHLLRMFHYATGIPVEMLVRNAVAYSLPEIVPCAARITDDASLFPVPYPNDKAVQYLSTPAFETFFLLAVQDGVLLRAGPVLQKPVLPDQLAPQIRAGLLPFRCKAELADYFASCPVLDDRHLFYSGKLLETLFLSDQSLPDLTEVEPDTGTPIDDSYYSQTMDYRTRQFQHVPYAIELEICRMIANGDTISSKHILGDINRLPRAKLANTPVRSLKNSLICSCTFMARAAISGGVKPDEAFTLSDAFIQRIEAAPTTNHLADFEAEMIESFTTRVQTARGSRHSAAVNQAMEYIDAHLSEPISISDIASAVYHNANYLSGLFKRETGETIHNYIVRRRIEEAEYFVRHSSDPIAEIAAFYQFCSQSHFVQCFRKIVGQTPGACRSQHLRARIEK